MRYNQTVTRLSLFNKQIERQNTPAIRSKNANISPFRLTFRDRGVKAISSLLALLAMLEPWIAPKLKQNVYSPPLKRSWEWSVSSYCKAGIFSVWGIFAERLNFEEAISNPYLWCSHFLLVVPVRLCKVKCLCLSESLKNVRRTTLVSHTSYRQVN